MLGIASLALGLVTVGTCHGDVTVNVLQALMEIEESKLSKDKNARLLALSLGLTSLGKEKL